MRSLLILAALLVCSGCVGPGKSGAHILKPWTWLSHREASATDRADGKVEIAQGNRDEARETLIKAAQIEVHRADLALASAPDSRPVVVASDAASNAASALDQAVGPLSVDESHKLRGLVAELLSENAAVRDSAEKRQQSDTRALIDAGLRLAQTEGALAAAQSDLRARQDDLRKAFDRENAKANQFRAMQWTVGGLAILSLVAGAGYLYIRISSGGLISSLVGGIEAFKSGRNKEDPIVSDLLSKLSSSLDKSDKKKIREVRATVA